MRSPKRREQGLTLIEMLVVAALISLMVGISLPSLTSGIDSLRLNEATNGVAGFFNSAMNLAERRQQTVEITISKPENALTLRSTVVGTQRRYDIPEGITIIDVLPSLNGAPLDGTRSFFLYPGGTVPQIGVRLMNRRSMERIVQVDPMTGTPVITKPVAPEP